MANDKNEQKPFIHQSVLDCEVKDPTGLNDFQKIPDESTVAIPRVGISRFRIPLNFLHGSDLMNHDAEASMYVNLAKGKTGINMSRLCQILQDESMRSPIDVHFMNRILKRYRLELRDEDNEPELDESFIKLKFNYPLKQKSLKSNNWGWQYYYCEFEAIQNKNSQTKIYLTVHYEYSSTCPCSLSMAKQYEQEFKMGKTTEGVGIGVPHGQRSRAICKVEINSRGLKSNFFVEDLINKLRIALPTETQSLVKRVDEQAFAILNGANPMFVEHASKRCYDVLNKIDKIDDWIISFEHWESLHSHNAVAVIFKNIPGGLREDKVF